MLKTVNGAIEKLFLAVGWPMFFAYIAAIFTQVLARNYLHIPLTWLDELARMLFLWTIMLGAAVAVRRRVHYDVVLVSDRHRKSAFALKVVAHAVSLAVMLAMLVYGWQYTEMSLYTESEALEVPWAYTYVSMPLAGAAMAAFWLETVIDDVRAFVVGTGEA